MINRHVAVLLALIPIISIGHAAPGESSDQSVQTRRLEAQTQALAAILKAADQICGTPPLTASSDHLELSGNAKAALSGVLSKITDLGIGGAAKYSSGHSSGVLQEQLAGALEKGNDCKLSVLKTLQTMIPGLSKTTP